MNQNQLNDATTPRSVDQQQACSLLIAAHCNNFMCAGTVMGRYGHDLMYNAWDSKIDPCDPKYFNEGFPFRIWRDSGVGYALGRNRPEYSIDGQARTAEEAVEMAGNDGVVVTANTDYPERISG